MLRLTRHCLYGRAIIKPHGKSRLALLKRMARPKASQKHPFHTRLEIVAVLKNKLGREGG